MVKAWKESVIIPTYEIGQAEKTPIFLEKRVYQGSSGVVYPYPVVEKIADAPTDHEWHAVWLENDYIKVMILPELGGRVQMAYDKIKQRHFIYYNHVIKPALVGLAGPWISGGIEFNWPQHHRPSTYMPVDCQIIHNADGSVTVWCNENERMFGQQGAAGFTLHEGCAYLEIQGKLYNRTDMPQTFLWWANPAVVVNEHYRSIFPPDIHAVFDHGKRAVSSFPIATGTYYKMDYSAGVDIANYKNIKVPTSYMAVNSKYNFEGGYENDTQAGMLHVARHQYSPGKKQWTWGNGDFGRAWDRNLTDKDENGVYRPYIELMAGVYTENQPDFSWLMPYEEKSFVQYFMPFRELGEVKQATKDLILNVENGEVMLFATHRQSIHVIARQGEAVRWDEWVDVSPEQVLRKQVGEIDTLTAYVNQYGEERVSLSWEKESDEVRPIPDAAQAALDPVDVKTNDQLYLTGVHIEQYRHATYVATDYYEEALRRDPNDVCCLNAMGLWYIRKGRFSKAEEYLHKAVKLIMQRNPNPYDGEPIYNLGLALKYQGRYQEAYEWFWKSTWNKAWADAGYLEAAKISIREHRLEDALDELNRSLTNGAHNRKSQALKATTLRLMGRLEEMKQVCQEALAVDAFNYGCLYELGEKERIKTLMHHDAHNYDVLALEFAAAGLTKEAHDVWQMAIEEGAVSPMTYYYLGRYEEAEKMDYRYCFPNSLEALLALEQAKKENPAGARAPYYLGCLYMDKRQYDLARTNWELSAQLDNQFATVWRNLALLAYNKEHQTEKAVEMMERAFSLDKQSSRILMELDQLYKRLNRPAQERLRFLEQYPDLVEQRDDLVLEHITLMNVTGQYERAKTTLDAHQFHPWEGGEGKVPAQYQLARVELAKQAMEQKQYNQAIELLEQCLVYPPHLGEGKLHGAQENDFYYYLGLCHQAKGDHTKACECWEQATKGPQEPAAALYYNDANPLKIYYQGLALIALGRIDEAKGRFYKLLNYGKQHLFDHVKMDYFAVSLPDLQIWEGDLTEQNRRHCLQLIELGEKGLKATQLH